MFPAPLIIFSILARGLLNIFFLSIIGTSNSSFAQVVTDITPSGPLGTVVTPNGNTYNISGGTRVNSSLFHSLGRFSVGNGDIANFQNAASNPHTSNILARVTDGFQSAIDGTIKTTGFGAADLFLLNPAGTVFSAGASLDVGGSFHISTADYVDLKDGGRFYSDLAQNSTLTAAAPSAFGFLPSNAGTSSIIFDGADLRVANKKSITAVAATRLQTNINFKSGILDAPSGRIELSLNRPGDVIPIDLDNLPQNGQIGQTLALPQGFNPTQDVLIQSGVFVARGATIDTTGSSGNITIRSGQVGIRDGASIKSDSTTFGFTSAGNILIDASDFIYVGGRHSSNPLNTSNISTSSAFSGGSAGSIQLSTHELTIDDGAITSNASFPLLFTNPNPGQINIDATTVTIKNGGQIGAPLLSGSQGGTIIVNASDSISITGANNQIASSINSATFNSGDAGNIKLTTTDLNLRGKISTSSAGFLPGSGNGGQIDITASNAHITGQGIITSNTTSDGNAGRISIKTENNLIVDQGGQILSNASNANGTGGNINISAQSLVVADNGSAISAASSRSSGNPSSGLGNAGSIDIDSQTLDIRNSGLISTSTQTDGSAGNIQIATEKFSLENNGKIESTAGSKITNNQLLVGIGNAGNINIRTNSFTASGGSQITAVTHGPGVGGSINIASTQAELSGGSSITAASTGSNLNLTQNPNTGSSGNIAIQTARIFRLRDGSSVSITTQQANAGSIDIQVGNILHLMDSSISTSVANGTGNGGNITIDPNFVVLENGSGIIGNSQQGAGGNIFIVADFFFNSFSPDSIVSASSQMSIDGTVVIRSPDADNISSTLRLPESFLDATAILPERCAARSGKAGNFVIKDREGLPPHPDTILPSSYHDIKTTRSIDINPSRIKNYSSWLLGKYNSALPVSFAGSCTPQT